MTQLYGVRRLCLLVIFLVGIYQLVGITRCRPTLETVTGGTGKIFGGEQGHLWKAIKKHRKEFADLSDDEWKQEVTLFAKNVGARLGLYKEQKLNLIAEIVQDRFNLLSPVELKKLLLYSYKGDRNQEDAMLGWLGRLGYTDLLAKIEPLCKD